MTTISSLTSNTTTSTTSVSSGIGGLVSGLDTDSLVESLSAVAQTKVDTQSQKLQKLEWKQEAYRTVISAMKEFEGDYLDVLSDTYIGSSKLFNTTAATSSSEAVSVSTKSNSYEGSFTIDSIDQLATAETLKSTSFVTSGLTGSVNLFDYYKSGDLTGASFSLTLDGVTRTITLDEDSLSTVTDAASFVNVLQGLVDDAFGVADENDRVITVSETPSVDFTESYLTFSASGSALEINAIDGNTTALDIIGLTDGQSNTLSTSTALGELDLATDQGSVDTYEFTVNGVDFSFDSTVSLTKMMSQINSSDAGVTISYSSITDKFTLTADDTGAGDNINVEDTSGALMSAFGLTAGTGTVTAGKNAILTIDGTKVIRSTNSLTVEGVTVKLEDTSNEAITVKMQADSSPLKDTITKFVEDYNTLIDLINTYITEDYDSDYQPLTDAQKEDMTDDQIEKWEATAKTGILKGDSTLRSLASKLQQTMYASASDGGISLMNLGITSAGYGENGKLEIDEDALERALSTQSGAIADLFTSDTGLSQMLTDIFDDTISTSGTRGSRGSLVELAGVEDTLSATQNSLYDQMEDLKDFIEKLQDRLDDEQTRLWNKFSAMETALSNLNTQSSLLSSFTSA